MEFYTGDKIIFNGKETAISAKWAMGQWHVYKLQDGREFSGEHVAELVKAGNLKKVEDVVETPKPRLPLGKSQNSN